MQITLDPSINNTGYAIFHKGKLIKSGVIRTKGEDPVEKIGSLATQLSGIIGDGNYWLKSAVVEVPASFSYARSTGTHNGKSLNQGSLQKLNWAIGALLCVLVSNGIKAKLIEATKWKVRRTKEMDIAIVKSLTGKEVKADEADAILLGEYARRL